MQRAAQAVEVRGDPGIVPFWQRIPQFFLYPWHLQPLLYMLFLAAVSGVYFLVPLPTPFDLIIVLFGVWLAFMRYAYKILARTAHGQLRPDQYSERFETLSPYLPYKQYAVFIFMGVWVALASELGPLFAGLVLLFCVVATPASVMALTITGSLRAAINPLTLLSTMRAIGLPYLSLCAFLFMLSASQGAVQHFLVPRLPEWLGLPVLNFVAMYFSLIMFNMMGYAVYQHHHELGVEADVAPAVADSGNERQAVLGRLVADGQLATALDLAYEDVRAAPDDLAPHRRYHALLLLSDQNDRLVAHGRRYLSALLGKSRGSEALQVYRALLERTPDFAPERPSELLRLAEAARQARDYTYALALIKGFDKRFPRHPEIPDVYLFAASMLCENLRQDATARQILQVLLTRYPEHAASGEGRKLLTAIERMAPAQS